MVMEMMANLLARVVLRVGAARMRNCKVSRFWKKNKWIRLGYEYRHIQILIFHPHGSYEKRKISPGDGLGAES